jgi:hypothetical protein
MWVVAFSKEAFDFLLLRYIKKKDGTVPGSCPMSRLGYREVGEAATSKLITQRKLLLQDESD